MHITYLKTLPPLSTSPWLSRKGLCGNGSGALGSCCRMVLSLATRLGPGTSSWSPFLPCWPVSSLSLGFVAVLGQDGFAAGCRHSSVLGTCCLQTSCSSGATGYLGTVCYSLGCTPMWRTALSLVAPWRRWDGNVISSSMSPNHRGERRAEDNNAQTVAGSKVTLLYSSFAQVAPAFDSKPCLTNKGWEQSLALCLQQEDGNGSESCSGPRWWEWGTAVVADNSLEVSIVHNALIEEIHELLHVTSPHFLVRELEVSSL